MSAVVLLSFPLASPDFPASWLFLTLVWEKGGSLLVLWAMVGVGAGQGLPHWRRDAPE